jgi:hypothetical protein
MPTPQPRYTEVGAGITDAHSPRRTTMAGVMVGTDGLMLLEIEEDTRGHAVRNYAEVAMSLAGFRALRDLMTAAILQAEAV